jgi:hypothetical protein
MTKVREVKIVPMEEMLVPKGWPSSLHLLLHLLISFFLSGIILCLFSFGGRVLTWSNCLQTWNLIIFTSSFLSSCFLLEPLTQPKPVFNKGDLYFLRMSFSFAKALMLGIFWTYNALNFSISFLVFTASSSKASHIAFFYDKCCFRMSFIFFASSNSTFSKEKYSLVFLLSFSNYINNCFFFFFLDMSLAISSRPIISSPSNSTTSYSSLTSLLVILLS